MRENCLQEFDKHWNCLELNNHVSAVLHCFGHARYEQNFGIIILRLLESKRICYQRSSNSLHMISLFSTSIGVYYVQPQDTI